MLNNGMNGHRMEQQRHKLLANHKIVHFRKTQPQSSSLNMKRLSNGSGETPTSHAVLVRRLEPSVTCQQINRGTAVFDQKTLAVLLLGLA